MRAYIDEYFDGSSFIYNFNDIKNRVTQLHNQRKSINDIVKHLQEWLYIEDDKEETSWEISIVENIINNKPIKNRFTGETFNVF